MALKAKKPDAIQKRLKLFMFGPAGVGKSTAAIQFPDSYIIDCERGTENYADKINASNSVVFQTNDASEVIAEVKALLSTPHEHKTLVIDPITTLYQDLLNKAEAKVGSDHGRHYGEADKTMRRLGNLIMALDMNVVVTAHAKVEYGANFKKLGYTFDGWKRLDYIFDLVCQLGRDKRFDPEAPKARGNERFARVDKTRIDAFPDGDVFPWSFAELARRYGGDVLARKATSVELATAAQVRELTELLGIVRLPDGTADKWLAKAGAEQWEDAPAATVLKCIDYVRARLPGIGTNGAGAGAPAPVEP